MQSRLRRSIATRFAVILVILINPGWGQEARNPQPAFVPKITISKETTWVTEPLKANGTIDYHAVINRHYSRGVTVENNSVVLLYRAMGPKPGGGRLSNEFFRMLGMEVPPEEGAYVDGPQFPGNHVSYSRPWTTQEFPAIAAWLQSIEKPLDLVVEATQRSEYFSPMVSDGADDPLLGSIGGLERDHEVVQSVARSSSLHRQAPDVPFAVDLRS